MSCGQHNESDCAEALQEIYEYLHYELDAERLSAIRAHLTECGECLREYGLEQVVRDLLERSCHCTAPAALRVAVLARITASPFDALP